MPDPTVDRPAESTGTSSERPRSVAMPSPPLPRTGQQHSPSLGGGGGPSTKPTTPTGQGSGGPMSPSTASAKQFVFPIRSVFTGISETDAAAGKRTGAINSRSPAEGRRFSESFGAAADEVDPMQQTIQQLLSQTEHAAGTPTGPSPQGAATAVFTGGSHRSQTHSPRAGSPPATGPESGFFSAPGARGYRLGEEPPFFARRNSDTSTHAMHGGSVKNDSTTQPGSGLPQQRPAVGQPQGNVREVNYRHDLGARDGDQFQSTAVSSSQIASPPPAGQQPASREPELVEPIPHRATSEHASASASGAATSDTPAAASDADSLIPDFANIVRLGDVGSSNNSMELSAGTPSNTTRSSAGGSREGALGGATEARLARQNRHNAREPTRRDPVRDFIEHQSHVEHMSDPNDPSPAPRDEEHSLVDSAVESDTDTADSSLAVNHSADSLPMPPGPGSDAPEIITFRFEHVQTSDGHHVVTGREGVLQQCEDEPITTPGAVQGFGVLIVLDEDFESGRFTVRQVSENATELLGLSPKYLFKLDCFTKILTADQEDLLRDNLEYLPSPGTLKEDDEGPQVFLLSGFGEPGSAESEDDEGSDIASRRREWTCWVAAHRPKQPQWDAVDEQGRAIDPPDLIVLEFELEKDTYNPLMQVFEASSGSETPDSGSQGTISAGSGQATDSSGSVPTTGSLTSVPSTSTVHRAGSDATSAPTERPRSSAESKTVTMNLSSRSRQRREEALGLDGLDMDHPMERILESTTNHARPLRALERMRRTGAGPDGTPLSGRPAASAGAARRPPRQQPAGSTGTMDIFAVLGQFNDQLGAANDLDTFLKITVGMIQDLCRFHRVLIYQFDENMNGQVVAEIVEWGKTTDLFKGLMFPASDIPAQARELYKINKVRLLYDRSQTTARLVLRERSDLDHPLDMTHCYLRAMSPIHIKYLANMRVRSSMSVSIMAFGQLWGLIACHSYGSNGMRVSFPVRQMMRILSDSISRNIERLSYAQRLHTRKLISTIPTQAHPTGYIVSNADDLLQIFDADAGLLVIGDGCKLLGQTDQGHAMLAIAEYLRIVKFDTLKATNHIAKDLPDLLLPRAHDTIAGLLYVPLTVKAGQDFIVFLRKGQVREVQWAGKPYKDERHGEQASLEPRKSFKIWSETVTGRARAWSDDQLESAGVLALIYGKFIQVWREKQSAMASNQLTAILLSNTSHAVRTPLSQIINTLELALSGNVDPDVRKMLENSHQASRALLFHVHDLLDLTRIETGNETAFNDPFDLRQTIADATRLYETETTRRGIEFKLTMADSLPRQVIGDSRKIKTVVSNLVANSVKFTSKGYIEVECRLQQAEDGVGIVRQGYIPIEVVVSDTGCGIPSDKLEAMFFTLEGADENRAESTGLGLGLAVVARIVEQLSGQLRAESEVGRGTRFFFTLQMQIDDGRLTHGSSKKSGSIQSLKSPPMAEEIIRRARTGSSGSQSQVSLRSGGSVSELDAFVNDFGGSHMLAPVEADDPRLRDAEARMSRPGTFPVTDSSWPVRASRMEADSDQSISPGTTSPRIGVSPNQGSKQSSTPRVLRRQSTRNALPSAGASSPKHAHRAGGSRPSPADESTIHESPSPLDAQADTTSESGHSQASQAPPRPGRVRRTESGRQRLRVMVVEDDQINSQILQKRLKMDKHKVLAVYNGQEAVDALRDDYDYDAVLMDIQMPIMDGRTAAREIRKLEATLKPDSAIDPLRVDGRIPIIAVSASLYENDRANLQADFDGWLLKPLDFQRVRALLQAAEDPAKRADEVYRQGHWERGGYFKGPPRTPSPGQ